MRQITLATLLLLSLPLLSIAASPYKITIQLDPASQPASATLTQPDLKIDTPGAILHNQISFDNLLPQTPYNATIQLKDGLTLTGISLAWCDPSPENPAATPLDDDDRQQIDAIVHLQPQFYNHQDILFEQGNHDRAVLLVQLLRDNAFHSDKGGEVIWRIEIWYFQNQHGGWERVSHQENVVRRERYPSQSEFQNQTSKILFQPLLGNLTLSKDQPTLTISLPSPPPPTTTPATTQSSTTQPATTPSE